jgi:hypothetical protein
LLRSTYTLTVVNFLPKGMQTIALMCGPDGIEPTIAD